MTALFKIVLTFDDVEGKAGHFNFSHLPFSYDSGRSRLLKLLSTRISPISFWCCFTASWKCYHWHCL